MGRRNSADGRQGTGHRSVGAQGSLPQAVLERPVAEVAAPVVRELRLALLAPAELSALEEQNRREPLIPVRTGVTRLRATPPRGDAELGPLPGTSDSVVTRCLPIGGANCGGVEVPRPTERRCGPRRTVPSAKGNPAPGSPPFSGPSFQMTYFRNLGGIRSQPKLQLPRCSALEAGFRPQQAQPAGCRKSSAQSGAKLKASA